MGTNYYWHGNKCLTCHRSDPPIHIGKSSAGWVFQLHVYPDSDEALYGRKSIRSLNDWLDFFDEEEGDGCIKDEYGKEVTLTYLLKVIACREDPKELTRVYADHQTLYARGQGTWDCFVGVEEGW